MNETALKVSDRRAVQDINAVQPQKEVGPAETVLMALRAGATVEEAERVGEMLLRFRDKEAAREAERAFNADFAKAMTEMPVIPKDKKADRGGAGSFWYSRIETILGIAQPVLGKHGLHLGFGVERLPDGKGITVTAVVRHEGGHSIKESVSAPIGEFSKANTHLQNLEGTVTALKRTLSMSILGLAVGGDEEEAPYVPAPETINGEQIATLEKLLSDTQSDKAKFLALGGLDSLDQMRAIDFDSAIRMLEQKRRKAASPENA